MEWTAVMGRVHLLKASASWICFCRALTTHSRPKTSPQQRFEKRRQRSIPSSAHHETSRHRQEISSGSFGSRQTDNSAERAERRRMSAEFAAMRREELERFPESSKSKTAKSVEQKSFSTTHARPSSSIGSESFDKKRFSRNSSSKVISAEPAKRIVASRKQAPIRQRWSAKPTRDSIPETISSRSGAYTPKASLERAFPSAKAQPNSKRISPESRERSKTSTSTASTLKSQIASQQNPNNIPTKPLKSKLSIMKPNTDSSRQSKISKRDLYIPIISESPHIVCINKPPALLSQPGLPGEGTILDLLRYQRPDLTLQTVNRLDKNTSGAMVLGRTETAVRELNLLFKENKIEKNYLALLKPKPGSPLYTPELSSCRALPLSTETPSITKGVLTKKTSIEVGKLTIIQNAENTYGYILTYYPDTSSASITHFHLLQRLDAQEKVLIQFTPLTGKKHQLRLHSAFLLGAPVVGDHRYGYPQDDGILVSTRMGDGVYKDGYALHCYRIASKEGIQFDVTAGFPGGRWGDVWNCVRTEVESVQFEEKVRGISKSAAKVFLYEEVQRIIDDPKAWAKGIRGPLVKQEIL